MMKYAVILLAFFLACVTPSLANMYITSPVDTTSVKGGHNLTVQWQDSSASPAVSQWGGINIWLAVGSQNVQYKLAQIGSNLKTSTSHVSYKVPANLGESGSDYFIRMESTGVAANGTANYMAFSAKFALTGMTGTFNSTIKAAIAGTSASSTGASSTAAASSATSSSASSSSKLTTSATSASVAKASGTSGAVSSAATTSTSGAQGSVQVAAGAVVAVGALAAAALAVL